MSQVSETVCEGELHVVSENFMEVICLLTDPHTGAEFTAQTDIFDFLKDSMKDLKEGRRVRRTKKSDGKCCYELI